MSIGPLEPLLSRESSGARGPGDLEFLQGVVDPDGSRVSLPDGQETRCDDHHRLADKFRTRPREKYLPNIAFSVDTL